MTKVKSKSAKLKVLPSRKDRLSRSTTPTAGQYLKDGIPMSEDEVTRYKRNLDRVTHWVLTPEIYRIPKTRKQLAVELGVTPSWINQLKKRIPHSIPDFLNMADEEVLAHHREIVGQIGVAAASGNTRAQSLYLKHIVGNRRQRSISSRDFNSISIERAMGYITGRVKKQLPVITIESTDGGKGDGEQ